MAGRYDNPIPPWFLAPIDFLKIPALVNRSWLESVPAAKTVAIELFYFMVKKIKASSTSEPAHKAWFVRQIYVSQIFFPPL